MNKKSDNYTLPDKLKIYIGKFQKLDKNLKVQFITIIILLLFILIVAITALAGKGKNPVSVSKMKEKVTSDSRPLNFMTDNKYEDAYTKAVNKYNDVVIQKSNVDDKNYFRETLFIGDSNTEGLGVYNHLSLQNVLGSTGMPIQNVVVNKCMWFVGYEEPVTMPTAVSMLKPRRIIINFGTNNAGGNTPEEFIRYYKKALNAIENAYPYSDIIVSSILPVCKIRDYPNIKMQDIDELNLALLEMCKERDLKFLNMAEVFKDPKNGFAKPKYFSKDGLHLTSDGYKALLDYVGSHKHIVPDNRPARGNIPIRREAPYISSSSSMMTSSVFSSSSEVMSSEFLESSTNSVFCSSDSYTSAPFISSSDVDTSTSESNPKSEVFQSQDIESESQLNSDSVATISPESIETENSIYDETL